ncbi:MAG: acid-inducible putative outer membrane protein YdiY [Sodalis sp. Psp]|nr:acid-inducible putative outer membrane protein YdiY [Sodalis sp. Psp]MCR3757201.1 acid-inducible putative outer membrane protein YdiY [Sodalis sp. Ppy]
MLRNKHFWTHCLTTLSISMTSFATFANTYTFTTLDDPFNVKKNFLGSVQANCNSHNSNTSHFNLAASINITWFQQNNAYSIWGEVVNNSSNDRRGLEKYQAGARARHNVGTQDFLFAQGNWLSDRYSDYRSRNTLVTGYGLQLLSGLAYTLRIEAGPGARYDKYQENSNDITKVLGYAAVSYSYQLTNDVRFIQGLSVFINDDIMLSSEAGLNIDINDHFALKFSSNVTWNKNHQEHISKYTDTETLVSLVYKIQ